MQPFLWLTLSGLNVSEMYLPHPLSHAYLICGGNAAGRREYARRLSAAYVCTGQTVPCGHCRHCKKAAADIHPDIITLTPAEGKREIVAEQARALRSDVYIRPNEAERKVYLIDPADSMNDTAQNALLKVLEDGPPYAAFLLLCAQPGQLLSTIRSRCETLTLPPADETVNPALSETAGQLAALLMDADEPTLCAFLCGLERDKIKTKDLQELFTLTQDALRPYLSTRPRQAAALLRLLRRCTDACAFNVGAGHLLGLLCVGREFDTTHTTGGLQL